MEEEIVEWECQLFCSDETEYSESVGSDVFYNVLSVELVSIKKKKKRREAPLILLARHSRSKMRRWARLMEKEQLTLSTD